ncbi:MAG TPA: BREX system ATP-binding domain-containing protein [Acetobacteraceae bacterium]|nr:BREX system ATP-binding domain-containing protein [Acetobacteraceae bacterium]
MDVIDVQPVPLTRWLQVIEPEYFADYLPAGGAGVKFLVGDETALVHAADAAPALAHRHNMLALHVSAGTVRLHMLQDVFFALARALPWDDLLQRYAEGLFNRNGYPWPRPGTALTMPDLASAFDTAVPLLERQRDQWLARDLWADATLAQDFRSAMLSLVLARLEPAGSGEADSLPVLQWLQGEKVGLTPLRHHGIAARIARTNARAMLVSLCHFVRKAGLAGLLLALDLRPALRVGAAGEAAVRYSPAAVMDLYEVLREVVDDIEHLPGLFLLALADQALMAGDRRRTLDMYKALEMRIWPDVRPGDRQNPLAPLVTVSG